MRVDRNSGLSDSITLGGSNSKIEDSNNNKINTPPVRILLEIPGTATKQDLLDLKAFLQEYSGSQSVWIHLK